MTRFKIPQVSQLHFNATKTISVNSVNCYVVYYHLRKYISPVKSC